MRRLRLLLLILAIFLRPSTAPESSAEQKALAANRIQNVNRLQSVASIVNADTTALENKDWGFGDEIVAPRKKPQQKTKHQKVQVQAEVGRDYGNDYDDELADDIAFDSREVALSPSNNAAKAAGNRVAEAPAEADVTIASIELELRAEDMTRHVRNNASKAKMAARPAQAALNSPQQRKAAQAALEAAQQENLKLRKRLTQSKSKDISLLQSLMKLKQAAADRVGQEFKGQEVSKLRQKAEELAAQKSRQHESLTKERKHRRSLEAKLDRATRADEQTLMARAMAHERFTSLIQKESSFKKMLKGSSTNEKVIKASLADRRHMLGTVKRALLSATTQLQVAQAAARASAKKIAELKAVQHQLKETARSELLDDESRLHKAEMSDKRINRLKKQLATMRKHLHKEQAREAKLNSTLNQTRAQIGSFIQTRSEKLSQLHHRIAHLTEVIQLLKKKAALMGRRARDGSASSHKAKVHAKHVGTALLETKSHITSLRGTAPPLLAKAAAWKKEEEKAKVETKAANEERDADQAMLLETKQKIKKLEGQYAKSVEMMHMA